MYQYFGPVRTLHTSTPIPTSRRCVHFYNPIAEDRADRAAGARLEAAWGAENPAKAGRHISLMHKAMDEGIIKAGAERIEGVADSAGWPGHITRCRAAPEACRGATPRCSSPG